MKRAVRVPSFEDHEARHIGVLLARRLKLRLLATVLLASLTTTSIFACNAVLGIQDVQLKGERKKGTDSGEPEPETPPEEQEEEDASVAPRANVLQTALGDRHTCARKPEGTVRCWGDDVQGQTGGGTLASGGFSNTPRDVKGITDAVDIAAGSSHTCVAQRSGTVSCWGFNLDGQLGNGETSNRYPAPVEVMGITNGFAVATGGNFSCALRGSGSVACWGGNGSGQLGRGNDSPSATAVTVTGLAGIVAIAAGRSHVCVAKNTGVVACWGDGANGQLGKAGGSPTPVDVPSINNAASVAAGERHSCAVTKTGGVLCWGANEHGQLGNGSPSPSSATPVVVAGVSGAVAVSAGKNHSCATFGNGTVSCWGGGGNGQIGDGKTRAEADAQATPVAATGVGGAVGVGAGGAHSCAPTGSNQIFCWGANDRGQLANAKTGNVLAPTAVTGF